MRKTQEAYLKHTQRSGATSLRDGGRDDPDAERVARAGKNRLLKERSTRTAAMESTLGDSRPRPRRLQQGHGHSRRVQQLAPGDRPAMLGLSPCGARSALARWRYYHDIGKLGHPRRDSSSSPSSLTDEEWVIMGEPTRAEGASIINRLRLPE